MGMPIGWIFPSGGESMRKFVSKGAPRCPDFLEITFLISNFKHTWEHCYLPPYSFGQCCSRRDRRRPQPCQAAGGEAAGEGPALPCCRRRPQPCQAAGGGTAGGGAAAASFLELWQFINVISLTMTVPVNLL